MTEPAGTLLVFVHGICGSASQLRALARDLQDSGTAQRFLTLPGHGGGSAAFSRARASDWQACVDDAVREGCRQYGRVVLVGHSLGGLLCLDAASRLPVGGVVCLSAPMGMRTGLFQIRMGLRVALRSPAGDDPVVRVYREARGVSVRGPWDYLAWTPAFLRLSGVIRRTRRILGRVGCPVLLVQSDRDEAVARRSADRIAGALQGSVRIVRLRRSRHAWIHPGEAAEQVQAIKDFISSLKV